MNFSSAQVLDTWQVFVETYINHNRAFLLVNKCCRAYIRIMDISCKRARTWNTLIHHNDTWISIITRRCESQIRLIKKKKFLNGTLTLGSFFMLRQTRRSNMTTCLIILFFLILNSGKSFSGAGRMTDHIQFICYSD